MCIKIMSSRKEWRCDSDDIKEKAGKNTKTNSTGREAEFKVP